MQVVLSSCSGLCRETTWTLSSALKFKVGRKLLDDSETWVFYDNVHHWLKL